MKTAFVLPVLSLAFSTSVFADGCRSSTLDKCDRSDVSVFRANPSSLLHMKSVVLERSLKGAAVATRRGDGSAVAVRTRGTSRGGSGIGMATSVLPSAPPSEAPTGCSLSRRWSTSSSSSLLLRGEVATLASVDLLEARKLGGSVMTNERDSSLLRLPKRLSSGAPGLLPCGPCCAEGCGRV